MVLSALRKKRRRSRFLERSKAELKAFMMSQGLGAVTVGLLGSDGPTSLTAADLLEAVAVGTAAAGRETHRRVDIARLSRQIRVPCLLLVPVQGRKERRN
jgi:hypothetical protein